MKTSTVITDLPRRRTMSDPRPIRIFVVAKLTIYIEGLLRLVSDNSDYKVIACVKPDDHCVERFCSFPSDILLVHQETITQPLSHFFASFKKQSSNIRILVFGSNMDLTFRCSIIRSGAHGYLNETMHSDDLYKAFRTVYDGGLWIEHDVFEHVVHEALELEDTIEEMIKERIDTFRNKLSEREIRVFQLVLEGLSTKEIPERIHLSEQGVKLYLGRLFRKFDVSNRSQLILASFQKVCPVSNLIRMFRMALDKRRVEKGKVPIISDPLDTTTHLG